MTDRQTHSVRTDAPEDDSLSESVDGVVIASVAASTT